MTQPTGSIPDPPSSDGEPRVTSQEQREPDLVTRPIELGWVRELRATDEQLDDFLFRRPDQ
jgi:hypothetical protein